MSVGKSIEATFCFVDIAGYSALTNTHGELAAADLVDDFSQLIRTSVEPLGQVNLAARVAARAIGGQILCTKYVTDTLAHAGITDIEVEYQGVVSLRNLPQPVDLYEIVLSSFSREYAIDPVCKIEVDTRRAARDLHFNKKTYWFRSLSCVERFARQPSSYV